MSLFQRVVYLSVWVLDSYSQRYLTNISALARVTCLNFASVTLVTMHSLFVERLR